ncbi:MAG: hypothetical protein NC324_04490 [Bacteroides sp.]|nr:hypothetical protein [Bacteroides sp.]
MNGYVFYTKEGYTEAPNEGCSVENCQVLGFVEAEDEQSACEVLHAENPWIKEAGFDMCYVNVEQIITKSQKQDIKVLLDYLLGNLNLPDKIRQSVNRLQQLEPLCKK